MNLIVAGLGLSASGSPVFVRLAPVWVAVLPKRFFATVGLRPMVGWPVNQNGLPLASRDVARSFVAASSRTGVFFAPRAGKSAVWKPLGTNRTESPARILMLAGKNWLASDAYFSWRTFWFLAGGPMLTVLVAACATAGHMLAMTAAATAAPVPRAAFMFGFLSLGVSRGHPSGLQTGRQGRRVRERRYRVSDMDELERLDKVLTQLGRILEAPGDDGDSPEWTWEKLELMEGSMGPDALRRTLRRQGMSAKNVDIAFDVLARRRAARR